MESWNDVSFADGVTAHSTNPPADTSHLLQYKKAEQAVQDEGLDIIRLRKEVPL